METSLLARIRPLPMLPLLVSLVAGILLQDKWLHIYSLLFWIIVLSLTVLLFLSTVSWRSVARKVIFLKIILAFFVTLILGAALAAFSNVQSVPGWYGHHLKESNAFKITIVNPPQKKAKTILLETEVRNYLDEDNIWHVATGKLLVYVYKKDQLPDYRMGQQLIIPNQLVPIRHNNNPFSFDFALHRKREGFYYQTFLPHTSIFIADSNAHVSYISKARHYLLQQLSIYIKDKDTRGLTLATMLNEKADLDEFIQQAYSNTGITHIIAISGMHVNIFFGLLALMLFWLKGERYKWLKYLLALPLVWLYIILTEYPPSAVRAAIMFSLMTIAFTLHRIPNPLNILLTTAFIMFCIEPMWIYHIGVQLSFLAVLSIYLFYSPLYHLLYVKNKLLRGLWQTTAVSIAVQILVFPLVIYYFHQFPIWFLPANLLAALFSVFLMTAAILIIFFGVLHCASIAGMLGNILSFVTFYFHKIITWMSRHLWDVSTWLPLDTLDYFLLTGAIIFLCIFWLVKNKTSLFFGLAILLVFIFNLMIQDFMAVRQERIIVYATNNRTLIGSIKGKTAHIYCDTSLSAEMNRFVLRPSFLGFRIKEQMPATHHSFLQVIQKDTIAFITKDDDMAQIMQVDYLIVSKGCSFHPQIWFSHLHPKQIIIDNSLPRWKAAQWTSTLREKGIWVHNVREDGAWVYNGRLNFDKSQK